MNSRIYLQPDAVPDQDAIRTANRLFRHFAKEVTFLQKPEPDFPDITMNRLRWAIVNFDGKNAESAFQESLAKAPNIVIDLANFGGDENAASAQFQKIFDVEGEAANLVIVKKSGEVLEFAKANQAKAKRK